MGQDIISGRVSVPGSGERTVTITAEALPGYLSIGDATWTRVYGKPTNLQLLSADDFRGTAGESLVPASAPTVHRVRYGREFPIVGARRIRWCAPEGYTAVSALAGNNEIHSSSNSHLLQIIEPLTDDVEIDIDVKEWPTSRGSGFALNMTTNSSGGGGPEIQFFIDGTQIQVRPIPGGIFRRDASAIGVWKIRRKGRIISVTSPTGTSMSYDGTRDTTSWGNRIKFLMWSSPGGVLRIGGIKVLGVI